jgi:hypothetical protein
MRTPFSRMSRSARLAVAVVALASLAGVGVVVNSQVASATSSGQAIVNEAASQSNYWYCNGGGGIHGPSLSTDGSSCPNGPGYDCMSLAQYAVYQVTGITVPINGEELPGGNDWDGQGTLVPFSEAAPGDVIFFGGSANSIYGYAHSGIFAGGTTDGGEVWDALATGDPVEEHTVDFLDGLYNMQQPYPDVVSYSGSGTGSSFTITTSSLPNATVGTAYSTTLATSGGTSPYTWKAKGLPRGLHIVKKTGVITGKVRSAKQEGSHTVNVTVTDSANPAQQATASLGLSVSS